MLEPFKSDSQLQLHAKATRNFMLGPVRTTNKVKASVVQKTGKELSTSILSCERFALGLIDNPVLRSRSVH